MERKEIEVKNPEREVEKYLKKKEVKKAFVVNSNSIVVFFKSKKILGRKIANA